jgi:hypothetical protein
MVEMEREELQHYEEAERERARKWSAEAVDGGVIRDLRPVYRDLLLPDSYGVQRHRAPLQALLFLYPTTIVFIPPTTEDYLRERVGMEWENFLELCDNGIIKPIIGHPTEYANLPHLDSLLRRHPPSVWARGDEVAHYQAGATAFWDQARKVLPLKDLLKVRWVREKWKRQYPHLAGRSLTQQIEIELCTNYVNLCIFGYENAANTLLQSRDAGLIARKLLEWNEVATYPQLLGVGGTMNYGAESKRHVEAAIAQLSPVTFDGSFLGEHVHLLLQGLDLTLPSQLDADTVKSFHAEGLAHHLWAAMEALEQELRKGIMGDFGGPIIDVSLHTEEIIQKAMAEVKSITYDRQRRRVDNGVSYVMKSISIAAIASTTNLLEIGTVGALLAGVSATGFAARTSPFDKTVQRIERAIADWIMSAEFSSLATHIWWVRRWRKPPTAP